jgi:hypothetical protein
LCRTFCKICANCFSEPDSLANLVTNLSVAECSAAESAYLTCIEYAISTLNLPNVAMYLDAGHAGWLGWSANIGPAATLFAQVYKAAGSPSQVRGLATNVANYNAWSIATAPSYTSGDSNYDEELYITNLAPLLTAAGYPAHFITDTCKSRLPSIHISAANQVTSPKWCSANLATCLGRLVQCHQHWLWRSTHYQHRKCPRGRFRLGQARWRMRCEFSKPEI